MCSKRYKGTSAGRKIVFCVCVFHALLALSAAREPGAYAGEPTEQIRATVDAVIDILNDRELKKPERQDERRSKISGVVERRFDFEEMARRSLALHWKDRTPAEKTEFVSLFSRFLEDVYIRKIERYEDEQVRYTDERIDGPYATVKTTVITARGTEIPVDYRIFKGSGKWEVYDIVIEGVSLVNTYRSQFNQIIRSGSYEELVRKLKDRVVR